MTKAVPPPPPVPEPVVPAGARLVPVYGRAGGSQRAIVEWIIVDEDDYAINDWLYERVVKDLPDTDGRSRLWEKLFEGATGVHALVCKVVGHDPTADHRGMPAHDHCEWCLVRTPGQAVRRA